VAVFEIVVPPGVNPVCAIEAAEAAQINTSALTKERQRLALNILFVIGFIAEG